MSDLNIGAITGNLTGPARLVKLPNTGNLVLEFRIGNNRVFKDNEGAQQKRATFIDCKMRGGPDDTRLAKLVPSLTKGTRVTLQYRLDEESWQDKEDGTKHSKHVLHVVDLNFAGTPPSKSGGGAQPEVVATAGPAPARAPRPTAPTLMNVEEVGIYTTFRQNLSATLGGTVDDKAIDEMARKAAKEMMAKKQAAKSSPAPTPEPEQHEEENNGEGGFTGDDSGTYDLVPPEGEEGQEVLEATEITPPKQQGKKARK